MGCRGVAGVDNVDGDGHAVRFRAQHGCRGVTYVGFIVGIRVVVQGVMGWGCFFFSKKSV